MERRVSVEDFTQRTETGGRDLFLHRFEKTPCHFRILVNAQMGEDKRANKPTPDSSLMIDAVAMLGRSAVVPVVLGDTHGQTPQSVRGQQAPGADIDDRFLLRWRKRRLGQRNRENLVRSQRRVVADAWSVDHVVAVALRFVPEF